MKQLILAVIGISCSNGLLAQAQLPEPSEKPNTQNTAVTQIETLTLPLGTQTLDSDLRLPQRGETKRQVLKTMGEPQEKYAVIGDPPISRWVYADFVLYFEKNLLLHSVVKPQTDTSQQ